VNDLSWKKSAVNKIAYIKCLPSNFPWKAVLPAPNTFTCLSENHFYESKTELMFKYAQILKEEIKDLAKLGFKYVQLSDPALVYKPTDAPISRDELSIIGEALGVAVEGVPIKTCLQTFFGDFSQILPEALDFPVDHLGIDLYETDLEKLKEYSFEKGVALGLVDSRNSLVEKADELVRAAKEVIGSIYRSNLKEIFICPNCDLEFLPFERAEKKMNIASNVATILKEEFYG
jgi:5-methyltetrahydropteroyltriglutamate--homocysteine methyltransferase